MPRFHSATTADGTRITIDVSDAELIENAARAELLTESALAIIEELTAAAAEGRSVVWLVSRVPGDLPEHVRAELVREAEAAILEHLPATPYVDPVRSV